MNSTSDYRIFKFRSDNRALSENLIRRLVDSIKKENLLHIRPIICNQKMEVIDGQHRLKAAEALGIEIYYHIVDEIESKSMLLLNVADGWTISDYFHYFCDNGYEEYLKLKRFIDQNHVHMRVALNLTIRNKGNGYKDFKKGLFVFDQRGTMKDYETCLEIVNHIRETKNLSHTQWLHTSTFWTALLDLVTNDNFDKDTLFKKLKYLGSRLEHKVNADEYREMLMSIYNYRNPKEVIITLSKKRY